jgi:glycerate kinase
VQIPLGDGGEGTARALAFAVPGSEMIAVQVLDPLRRPMSTEFALLPGGVAVVEMAAASGLSLLSPSERDPMRATTFGTGQLLRAALDLLFSAAGRPGGQGPPDEPGGHGRPDGSGGVRRPTVILGVGGSATVDGGTGMVSALGGRFLGEGGEDLGMDGGGGLARIAAVDLAALDPRIRGVDLILASDVSNPLLGDYGAAVVFGPQKGAAPGQVAQLDKGLGRLREAVLAATGRDMEGFPGAGAAGGLGAAAVAMLGARARSGIELALEVTGFDGLACGADLVITGEGRFDLQTLSGKAVYGVAAAAARHAVPVCVLAGSIDTRAEWRLPGACVVLAIADGPLTQAESERHAARLICSAARRAVATFAAGRGSAAESRRQA